jgi:uncharacterized protein YndB with AHSA1/START domain
MNANEMIHTEVTVHVPVEQAWKFWTQPEHIIKWNFASKDWHCPKAKNDLQNGGTFNYRMESRDKTMGFDFYGTYDDVVLHEKIDYTLGDDRKVQIRFVADGPVTHVLQDFEAETQNPTEMQKFGWQAIMDNYKEYAETSMR